MRLSDMYKTSTPVTFMAETDAEETVLVVKLNDPEQDEVKRKAGSARARAIAEMRDPDSDLAVELSVMLNEMTEEELIFQIINEELEQKLLSIQEEVAASPEWADDDYLRGLELAWEGSPDEPGLKVTGATTDEGRRVLSELSRYHTKVAELVALERDDMRAGYEGLDMDFLRKEAYTACVKRKADQVFMDEFIRRRTYMSTRVADDRRKFYFDSIQDYDDCDELMIKQRLMKAYAEMAVEGVEGKGSPGLPGSSPSSDQPATEPESAPSGRPAAKRSKTSRASG